jgi:O-antigen/teichoic acid export membrane protein
LKRRTISEAFLQLLQKDTVQIVALAVSVILARLIDHDQFNIVSMASIFIAIATVLAESELTGCTKRDSSL